jgi:cell division protein FtsW
MGGSSFLFTCLSIGIILSVARNVEQIEGKENENISDDEYEDDDENEKTES